MCVSKRDKMRDEKEDGIHAMAIFNKVPTYDRYENQPRGVSSSRSGERESRRHHERCMHTHNQKYECTQDCLKSTRWSVGL